MKLTRLLKLVLIYGAGVLIIMLGLRLFRRFEAPAPRVPTAPTASKPSLFQQLADYELPAGSLVYRDNPEKGQSSSFRTPQSMSVKILSRTDLGSQTLPSWAARQATIRCDGNFYLEVQTRVKPLRVYYVRPGVPYNAHLKMTWLQAKEKWPDDNCVS
jgi:hypothetical protein